MKLRPITYFISSAAVVKQEVSGYAIDSQIGVRLAVHKIAYGIFRGWWRCDHYDTGYCFGSCYAKRSQAITGGIRLVKQALQSGQYDRAIASLSKGS